MRVLHLGHAFISKELWASLAASYEIERRRAQQSDDFGQVCARGISVAFGIFVAVEEVFAFEEIPYLLVVSPWDR